MVFRATNHLSSQLTNKCSSKIITGDETWCFQYDFENKLQSLHQKQLTSPRLKKALMSKLQVKKMLITVYDIKDIIHFEFIPQGKTTNQAYDLEILSGIR
jgi:hypothetical protein